MKHFHHVMIFNRSYSIKHFHHVMIFTRRMKSNRDNYSRTRKQKRAQFDIPRSESP
jgi:hypothetical protein